MVGHCRRERATEQPPAFWTQTKRVAQVHRITGSIPIQIGPTPEPDRIGLGEIDQFE
jgi:hypothetical protein